MYIEQQIHTQAAYIECLESFRIVLLEMTAIRCSVMLSICRS